MKEASYEIKRRSNGELQFNLLAPNGMVVLSSDGYATLAAVENAIAGVRTYGWKNKSFDLRKSVNSKYYFNLKAPNGQVVAVGEMYESKPACENGIESVKKHCTTEIVVKGDFV